MWVGLGTLYDAPEVRAWAQRYTVSCAISCSRPGAPFCHHATHRAATADCSCGCPGTVCDGNLQELKHLGGDRYVVLAHTWHRVVSVAVALANSSCHNGAVAKRGRPVDA